MIATGIGGQGTIESQLEVMRERGARQVSPLGIPQYMPNAAAAAITMKHGIRGPELPGRLRLRAAARTPSGSAMRMIQYGEADAVVCGGTEATLTEFAEASFANMQALSPTGISRPFDLRRDGFVMGEGAGVLVLEAEDTARERGADGARRDRRLRLDHRRPPPDRAGSERRPRPHARSSSRSPTPAPTPSEVDYINAHGTSTQLNDAAETRAIKSGAREPRPSALPVSSTKSSIGHLLGAAGAVEAVATVRTLVTGVIAPTLGYEVPDPELDLDYVPGESRPLITSNGHPPLALSNSFAFGGHNVTLAIRGAQS